MQPQPNSLTPGASCGTSLRACDVSFANWADRGFLGEIIPIIPPGVPAKLAGEVCVGDGKTPGSKVLFHREPEKAHIAKVVANLYYGYAGWRTEAIHPGRIAVWEHYGQPSNIGLRTAQFPCLDIDIKHEDDRALVEAIKQRLKGQCAVWVRYRENSPSCAIAFAYTGEPFGKGSRAFVTKKGHEAKIELLAAGQQYVVDGMHASGAELLWRRYGVRHDSLPLAWELPTLQGRDGANALLDEIYELALARGCTPLAKKDYTGKPRSGSSSTNCGEPAGNKPPWTLQPDDDPFYQRLLKEEYCDAAKKDQAGHWKAAMNCPWESAHGERPETGTVYFIGGGFRCQHNSCIDQHWPEVEDYLRGLGWPVDAMQVQLWNARKRSVSSKALDKIAALRAQFGGAK
jgi:hypothetical protein